MVGYLDKKMANSPGTHHQDANHSSAANPNSGNSIQESSVFSLKHNPGIAVDWSLEEQAILEDGLAKYVGQSSLIRYAKIAMQLQHKTVRDVAMRCRWMTKKENSKRRKEEFLMRKSKDKRERYTDLSAKASHFMARPNVPPYSTPTIPMDRDDGISYKAIGGVVTGELLEQNAMAFNQISANLSTLQIQDNFNLLCQTRDNILKLMNNMNNVPELMKQMPALPVNLNEELANTILPRPNFPKQ